VVRWLVFFCGYNAMDECIHINKTYTQEEAAPFIPEKKRFEPVFFVVVVVVVVVVKLGVVMVIVVSNFVCVHHVNKVFLPLNC